MLSPEMRSRSITRLKQVNACYIDFADETEMRSRSITRLKLLTTSGARIGAVLK